MSKKGDRKGKGGTERVGNNVMPFFLTKGRAVLGYLFIFSFFIKD